MEAELVTTFEAAKKAADAAEDERCVDALKTLRKLPVSMEVLVKTQVGKKLRYLTKHPHKKIQAVANDLLNFWKNVVIEETTKDDNKGNKVSTPQSPKVAKSESGDSVKSEKFTRSGSVKAEAVSRSSSFKVEKSTSEKGIKRETASMTGSVKMEKSNSDKRMKTEQISKTATLKVERSDFSDKGIKMEATVERVSKTESVVSNGPPKLNSLIKCNDAARDKVREIVADAVSKVYKETSNSERDEVKNILDEVDACDPFRVAVTVESALYEKLGSSTGAHKAKYRSIIFNLKDPKNPDFRRRVLLGEVEPHTLVDMSPEDMASDERKRENKQIKDKALFECERAGAPKATTDQFKCGRCGQRKATYYQLQTRSADEPMTTFVTCVNCNNHWKFC